MKKTVGIVRHPAYKGAAAFSWPDPGPATAGYLEYDPDNRWLIFTELLGPNEAGSAAIVAENVPAWFGKRIVAALPWPKIGDQ